MGCSSYLSDMNRSLRLMACFVISGLAAASAQTMHHDIANGAILSQKPCAFGPYEEQSAFTKRYYSKKDYDSARSNPRTECLRIEYGSRQALHVPIAPERLQAAPVLRVLGPAGALRDVLELARPQFGDDLRDVSSR